MNKFLTLTLMAVITAGLAACDNETTETSTQTMPNGTTVETTTEVERSDDGMTIEQNRRVNPEGAMNERETTREIEVETDR